MTKTTHTDGVLRFAPPWPTRDEWQGWGPEHWKGAAIAVAALVFTLLLQITLLSSWHLGAPIDALALSPVNEGAKNNSAGDLVYSFKGPLASAATGSINVPTEQMLAIAVHVNRVPDQTVMTVGWVSTRDLKRQASLSVRVPATNLPRVFTVTLRGNPQWIENTAQMALALNAPAGSSATTVSRVDVISATPLSSLMFAAREWFGDYGTLDTPANAQRVLPLTAWITLACALAFSAIAWTYRARPIERARSIVGSVITIVIVALFCAILAPTALTLSRASLAWIACALAVCVCASPWHALMAQIPDEVDPKVSEFFERFDVPIAALLAFVLAAVAIFFGGIGLSWIVVVVILLLVGRAKPELLKRFAPFLFFAPLVVGGIALLPANPYTELRDAFVDPSATFAGLVSRSAGAFALLVGALAAQRVWPAALTTPRFSLAAGLASWYALIGTLLALSLPTLAQQITASAGAVWVLLPLLACVALFVVPAFRTISTTARERVADAKTEHDLSAIVRSLFDGSLASFDQALVGERKGSALVPLNRMREIAPASLITQTAALRYGLALDDLPRAAEPYALLKSKPVEDLPQGGLTALVQYAHLTNEYAFVIEHAPNLDISVDQTRILAHAQLNGVADSDLESGRQSALKTLQSFTQSAEFAREIAELHLLADEWQLGQQALIASGIEITSLAGEIYVSRLGMRAAGTSAYMKQVNENATWNPELGIAHAAMGDMMRIDGNAKGARARYVLACKLDGGLWALQPLIKMLDAQIAQIENTDHRSGENVDSQTAHTA